VTSDDTVMVIGAGPIGLAATLGAVDRGARVMVVDRIPARLKFAQQLGAAAVVNTSEDDLARAVEDFTQGDGMSVVVEATGVPALVNAALDAVANSGTVVVVGISDGEVSIPVGLFSRKEINILGSRNNVGLFPEAIRLARQHADQLGSLVTHTYPLIDAPQAIEYAMTHPNEVEKAVILIGGVAE
jgi:threonine dehydrogenase-like Zn-dependent dehydrogenase